MTEALAWRLLERGPDRRAEQYIVRQYFSLVPYIVSKMSIPSVQQSDALSAGYMGLCKAITGYRCGCGLFLSFAGRCIANEIISALKSP